MFNEGVNCTSTKVTAVFLYIKFGHILSPRVLLNPNRPSAPINTFLIGLTIDRNKPTLMKATTSVG